MNKYVSTVEAVQWTGQDYPGVLKDYDSYVGIDAGHCYKGFKIHLGDWIVRFPNLKEVVMTNAEFTTLYQPYYGSLPVDQEIARLYNRVNELDNEVVRARFGGNGY